jgi:hypothetical protein
VFGFVDDNTATSTSCSAQNRSSSSGGMSAPRCSTVQLSSRSANAAIDVGSEWRSPLTAATMTVPRRLPRGFGDNSPSSRSTIAEARCSTQIVS